MRMTHAIHSYAAGMLSGRTSDVCHSTERQVGEMQRAEPRMQRLVVALVAVALLLITAVWMSRPDWQRLVVFLAIVTVAAVAPRQPAQCRPPRSIRRERRPRRMVLRQRMDVRLE
jgi:hypothetical protein